MPTHTGRQRLQTIVYTVLALVAFAANSVLCRLALGDETIDAASFTTIRLVSGAITLLLISAFFGGKQALSLRGNWISAAMLFLYAVAFSFSYITLSAGTGALILFGAVQATMILVALRFGERPHFLEWSGLVIALVGLVYLVFPGLTAPSPTGSALMAVAGIAWGVYSLRGRGNSNPLADTTSNFVYSVPLVIAVSATMLDNAYLSNTGVLLAVSSGALASGLGYIIWYAALTGLTTTRAATVQLSVPILAAVGGVIFLSEAITLRLLVAATLILGGVGLAVVGRGYLLRLRSQTR